MHFSLGKTKEDIYLTREAQVFEKTPQSFIQVCKLGHVFFALAALLVVFQRVKVLSRHRTFVFAHMLPIGQQLREMTPGKNRNSTHEVE